MLLERSKEVLWLLKMSQAYKSYSLDKNNLYKYNDFQTDFLFYIHLSKTNQHFCYCFVIILLLISKLQLYS